MGMQLHSLPGSAGTKTSKHPVEAAVHQSTAKTKQNKNRAFGRETRAKMEHLPSLEPVFLIWKVKNATPCFPEH